MSQVTFQFHGEVNDFLPRERRSRRFAYTFDWKASIKDMVESLGPPHTEIHAITFDGRPVDFETAVPPDVHIDVYARAADVKHLDTPLVLTPEPPAPTRFVLDTHLGRLANYLRMMGFDTLYRNDYPDDELAIVSNQQDRVLLTRDIGLLKRSLVIYGRFMRETNPRRQIVEVMQRYNLSDQVAPFRRCIRCNGLVQRADKAQVIDQIPPDSAARYDVFHQCQQCGQVYWKGSHFERMQAFIDDVLAEPEV